MVNPIEVSEKWLDKANGEEDYFDKFVYCWFAFNALYSQNMQAGNSELDAIMVTVENNFLMREYDIVCEILNSDSVKFFHARVVRNLRYKSRSTYDNNLILKRGENQTNKFKALFKILYTVRCNLFHGNKLYDRDSDMIVVKNAANILEAFLKIFLRR